MKNKPATLLIAAAAAVMPLIPALGADESPIIAYNATQALPALPLLSRGASADSVRSTIGEPPTRLAPDVWVYWNYRAAGMGRVDPAFDTLIVTFDRDRVVDFRLVDGRAVEALLARAEKRQAVLPAIADAGIVAIGK